MSEPTPGPTAPQAATKKASPVRIIVMLALGGAVLAVGGCALFLANLNIGDGGGRGGSDNLSALGALLFAAGCLAFLVGIIWAIARGIDRRFARAAAAKEKATSSTSSTDTER
jgi:hypothetical protein